MKLPIFLFLAHSAFAAITYNISPAPLQGNNGTFGWGFTLTNTTSSYISVDSVQLGGLVDDPALRFGPVSNFTDLFSAYQFSLPTIAIAPNSVYTLAYDGSSQGLATWLFPDGFPLYGNLASNVFPIVIVYSQYDDDSYSTPTLDGNGNPITGQVSADAQLQFAAQTTAPIPEPATLPLVATGLAIGYAAIWRGGLPRARKEEQQ